MSKHTPGPWEIERYSDGLIQIVGDVRVVSDDEEHVTTIVEDVSYSNEANANLIAAAPDLLEALEEIMGMVDLSESIPEPPVLKLIMKARAAIARAKGEGQ